jgi:hypothetical protein
VHYIINTPVISGLWAKKLLFFPEYIIYRTADNEKNDPEKREQISKLLSLYTANLLSQRQENPVRG